MTTLTKPTLKEKLELVSRQIGNTPLLPVRGLHANPEVQIYAKVEWEQLSGSVKARAAFNIIRRAVESGALNERKILLDATSGNTGIAYAAIARELGLKTALCLPENASKERREILEGLRVHIIYTSRFGGTDEAQEVAKELADSHPDQYFYASQYTNENNWKAHYYGTAEEIYGSLPGTTCFVAGLGTTGTFIGTSRRLKELIPGVITVSLQPDLALHGMEGWKHLETAIVPAIYDPSEADRNIEIGTDEAYEIIRRFRDTQGILISPSSAANIAGALKVAGEIEEGTVVTVLPDNADKYSEVIKQIL